MVIPQKAEDIAISIPEEELDLQHDPVTISLYLPTGIKVQPNVILAGVTFEPPIGIIPGQTMTDTYDSDIISED